MKRICLGIAFLTLDFSLTLGSMKIGLLPDFFGYYLILRGMQLLELQCPKFRKLQPVAIALTALSLVPFVMDLLALRAQISLLSIGMGLVEQLARLLMVYVLVKGVQQMEKRYGWQLLGGRLQSLWLAWALVSTVAWLCSWIPLVGTVAVLAAAILAVCLLVAFFQTAKRHQQMV